MDHDPGDERVVTIVTWNVQGAFGVDVDGMAAVLRAARPDVVVLQEVGSAQARRLAAALDMQRRWAFKHLAWGRREGLAVLTPHRIVDHRQVVVRRGWWWDWRRRIALAAELALDGSDGGVGAMFWVADVHLSPHDHGVHRRREAERVVALARSLPSLPLIAGDCNDVPDGAGPADLVAAGWRDAWSLERLADADGSTNWTGGERTGRPPTQRLDYVFAPPDWEVADAAVLADAGDLDWFAARSDHLPLSASLRPPVTLGGPA